MYFNFVWIQHYPKQVILHPSRLNISVEYTHVHVPCPSTVLSDKSQGVLCTCTVTNGIGWLPLRCTHYYAFNKGNGAMIERTILGKTPPQNKNKDIHCTCVISIITISVITISEVLNKCAPSLRLVAGSLFARRRLQKLQNDSPQNFRDLVTCLSCH